MTFQHYKEVFTMKFDNVLAATIISGLALLGGCSHMGAKDNSCHPTSGVSPACDNVDAAGASGAATPATPPR
jgi:hypothetical protein